MLSYEEVYERINNAHRFGKEPGVKVMEQMLSQLGHPARDIPYIHVAGTNGKGSVCAFLTQMLRDQGEKVGTFISPHLIDFEERITVNGEQIHKEEVQEIGSMLLQTQFALEPTMFDYCLAMALIYFARQGCSVMVIETGLGGRLDSTNALGIPKVCVITKIGYDHTAILGNTLAEIAGEKAGIMKKGAVVVTEQQEPSAMQVLKNSYVELTGNAVEELQMVSEEEINKMSRLPMELLGPHQWENGAAALRAALAFNRGYHRDRLEASACRTQWMGRLQKLNDNPLFLVDGAHNWHGVQALAKSLRQLYPGEQFHFIMAVMADKDYLEMIEEMLPLAKDFTTFAPESQRALQGEELARQIASRGVKAQVAKDLDAIFHMRDGEKYVAFGSLYFIGDVIAHWKRKTIS